MSLFTERLKELRAKAGITQKEAVAQSGIPYRTYQDYELGKCTPTLPRLALLANLYGVPTDYLAGMGTEQETDSACTDSKADVSTVFIDRLRKLRVEKRLTQAELAKELGIATRQYQRYESGDNKPSVSRLMHISKVLGVSLDYLTGLSNERE